MFLRNALKNGKQENSEGGPVEREAWVCLSDASHRLQPHQRLVSSPSFHAFAARILAVEDFLLNF